MANTVDKIRIQQALIDQVRAAKFYEVSYDPETNKPADIDTSVSQPTAVAPASVGANETSSSFSVDTRHGRSRILKRDAWRWQVRTKFNTEVTAYVAEENWLLNPPTFPGDSNLRQVTLELVDSVYEHPPRQESHNGSRITFTFEARLGRR